MGNLPTTVVAMSGGVDSSVAAALLVEQGYPVVGMMLRLWSEPDREGENRCCTPDAMAQARRVAAQIGIPFYAIDARERFRSEVVESFLQGYSGGQTPNPCIVCNRQIRWGLLLKQALTLGAEFMATGHYARVRRQPDGTVQLLKGVDEHKDQSYVLSALNQEQLRRSIFPLGEMTKPEVREEARRLGLPVAERADSQDLCFLASQDYRSFLSRHAQGTISAGVIQNSSGEVVGQHQGLSFYTIGQRKGLGIVSEKPLYVLDKNLEKNILIVGTAEELGGQHLHASRVNWVSGLVPDKPFSAEVKIRYKANLARADVNPFGEGAVEITFEQPLRDITPGQLAVIYQGEVVLGSGIID